MSLDLGNIQQPTKAQKSKGESSFVDILNKDISLTGGRWTDKKKEPLYNELAVLLEAGMDIRSALDIIASQQKKDKDRQVVEEVRDTVVAGSSLSEAVEKSGKFTSYEYFSIRIGEETGELATVLHQLAGYYKKSIAQRRQIINALSYPIIVITAAIGAIIFMMFFIVPMFSDIFARFDAELPSITQGVVTVSQWFGENGLLAFGILAGIIIFLLTQKSQLWYRKIASAIVMRLPIVGPMVRKVHLARFCNIMALLIGSKVNLLKSLDLVGKMTRFYPIESSIEPIKKDVTQGRPLHESVKQFKVYDSRMVALIKVGEEVNQLENFFRKIGQQYDEDVEHTTSVLGNLIEPILLIFLGLVVGTILVAMYLPLFKLSTSVGI